MYSSGAIEDDGLCAPCLGIHRYFDTSIICSDIVGQVSPVDKLEILNLHLSRLIYHLKS